MLSKSRLSCPLSIVAMVSLCISFTSGAMAISGGTVSTYEVQALPPGHTAARWSTKEDNEQSETLSVGSLLLSSTLVVRVHPERIIAQIGRGPRRFQYKMVRVTGIVKHGIGVDGSTKIGDRIVVVDVVHNSGGDQGEELMTDLALLPSDDAVIFLQRLPKPIAISGLTFVAHRFTAPMVSKYQLDRVGRLIPMSVRPTRASRALRMTRLDTIFSTAIGNNTRVTDEASANSLLLAQRRNVLTAPEVSQGLQQAPWAVEGRFAAADAKFSATH